MFLFLILNAPKTKNKYEFFTYISKYDECVYNLVIKFQNSVKMNWKIEINKKRNNKKI